MSNLRVAWQRIGPRGRSFALFGVYFALHYGYSLLSEKIQARGGLGMDGQRYAFLVKQFDDIANLGLVEAKMQRILPSGIVHLLLRTLGLPLENSQIIGMFAFLDSVSISVCFVAFYWITHHFNLNRAFRLLGLAAFALSFATLKWVAYYPILTDSMAMALASGMFLAYLKRKSGWIVALVVAASFTWPALVVAGYALLALPRRGVLIPLPPLDRGSRESRLYFTASGIAAAVVVGSSVWILYRWNWQYAVDYVYQPVLWALPISYVLLGAYLIYGLFALAKSVRPFYLREFLGNFSLWGTGVSIVLFFSLPWVRRLIFNSADNPPGFEEKIIGLTLALGVASPGRFIIPHIVYFGPILIFTILYWSRICDLGSRLSAGVVAVLAMGLLQSLDSESRHLTHLFPIILPLTLLAMQHAVANHGVSDWFIALFVALTAVFSRAWFTVGGEPRTFDIHNPADQRFYMHIGAFVTADAYAIQVAAVVVTGLSLYVAWRTPARSAAEKAEPAANAKVSGSLERASEREIG